MKLSRLAAVGVALLSPMLAAEKPPQHSQSVYQSIDLEHFDATLLAQEIFQETNAIRVREGVAAVKPEPRLSTAASGQAAVLALRIHTGHDSPLAHRGDPYARVLEAGLPPGLVGENAATLGARNHSTNRNYSYYEMAALIVQAWMDSPGHRANLLNPSFRYLGCGTRAAYLLRDNPVIYSIQDFYTPAPRPDPFQQSELPGGGHLPR